MAFRRKGHQKIDGVKLIKKSDIYLLMVEKK
jgi:hypothetical protein